MTLEDQLALVQRYGKRAYALTLRTMKENPERILEMMPAGIELGFEQYGDHGFVVATWNELHQDTLEELRDACNRGVMKLAHGWPT